MPITYTDITYIQNGQAINAANLNAPSVALATRTDEIKRDSDQSRFSLAHTTDSEVILIYDSSEQSSIVIRTELREDGSADRGLIKYYLPEFNNIKFSIYPRAVHGGRYIIDGADIGSLFSDSVNASNPVLATALSVPGDGVYAKIPLRHTGSAESLTNYPDLAYPKTRAQSIGSGYLASAPTAELVKLPELVLMDFLSAQEGESVTTFTDRLLTQFPAIDALTVLSGGGLQLLDANSENLTLKIYGTQEGADCTVTHLLEREDGEPGFVAKFSRASAPIYIEHGDRVSTVSIGVSLHRGATELARSLVPITSGSYTGYFILPELLDPNYSYIPLVRLTENSMLVGDKNISLTTRTLPNGETLNIHGDPVYGVPPEFLGEGTEAYELNILSDGRTNLGYTGSYSIDIGNHAVDSEDSAIDSGNVVPVDVAYLKSALQIGDKVLISGVTLLVTDSFVSSLTNPAWAITASVTVNSVTRTASAEPYSSPKTGDVVELAFSSPISITAAVQGFSLRVTGKASADGDLLTGAVSATFNIRVI